MLMVHMKVNASSAAGLMGFANMGPYVASKHAVIGMTRTAAKENPHIRFNCVAPGMSINGRGLPIRVLPADR